MSKLWTALKLVAINLFVLLVIVWSLNLVASILLDSKYLIRAHLKPVSKDVESPALADKALAERVYRDYALVRGRYVPYLGWSRAPYAGDTTNVNAAGDRVHAPTTERPIGHLRLFGGSTIWGKGVDDENTIPAHFNALYPGYEVHNNGDLAYVSRQELARLVNLVNQNQPMDLVIFYDGCNDAYALCRADTSINGHRREARSAARLTPPSVAVEDLTGSLQRKVPALAKILGPDRRGPMRCLEPDYARRVAETLVNNWKIARQVAALAGAEFHAVLQPLAYFGSPKVDYLDRKSLPPKASHTLVYPIVQEIIAREDVPWMHDFTDAFDGDEAIYIDACHVNARGNQIIAERLSEIVGQHLKSDDR